jgi:hypothetical protein
LRRLGCGEADAEVGQQPAEVRRVELAGELLVQAPVPIVAHEDVEPIAVERHGTPKLRHVWRSSYGVTFS